MKEHRHPHPHVDPRQPRHGACPGVNPPVFVWKPVEGATAFRLTVARDEGFRRVVLDLADLTDPMLLPERALPPGRYWWKWSAGPRESEVFSFDIAPQAVILEVPPAAEWLRRLPPQHPRIYIRPEQVPALRQSRLTSRAEAWQALRQKADELLAEDHGIHQPDWLPDRRRSYKAWFDAWLKVLQDSRGFMAGAQTLALAYLAGGEAKYARAACARLDSISRWDPSGPTSITHNDEAHMSVIWDGPQACDWVWDQFTDDQRARVVGQFVRRGGINYEHMHDRGMYGVQRFDSHAGREIVFLAQIALVFHEHIPEAAKWLQWLRPVLCGVWPIWAGDDGGWAEGPSYATAYVSIMTMFATSLKAAAGVDLYRKPFWLNHARWRQYGVMPYARWTGFGDNGLRPPLEGNADLVETIDRQTGAGEFAEYVAACRREAGRTVSIAPLPYLGEPVRPGGSRGGKPGVFRVFPYAGLAAVRTHLDDPSRDVAFLFRSSPLGSVSHSHANCNDFALHVAGEPMLVPSGFYDGYGSAHHAHWTWQTRSHNCLTLSDAGQRVQSHDSIGAVENPFEDQRVVYFRGRADAAYDRTRRCRRHVVFLKPHTCFVLIDEFEAEGRGAVGLQWNAHSLDPFTVEEPGRTVLIERAGGSVRVHLMYHDDAYFLLGQGWDPPPMARASASDWPMQYHLRFAPTEMPHGMNLGVVLCPAHAHLSPPLVATEKSEGAELARIGDDQVRVARHRGAEHKDLRPDALAALIISGQRYDVTDAGLRPA